MGIILGFMHDRMVKINAKRPPKYIDPYSKKAIKMRDRQIREEEEELKKYRDDDKIKLRQQEIEEDSKKKKHRGDE